jgi:hypothetical protein
MARNISHLSNRFLRLNFIKSLSKIYLYCYYQRVIIYVIFYVYFVSTKSDVTFKITIEFIIDNY